MNIPVSAYRVQFTRDFRFVDCRDLVPYLHELGVGALYSSPRFRPRRGSSHGYDVADPARVNSELGTDEEFDDLCEKLRHYGMGLVLDIVPNHMAACHENPWWMDVLENGPSSAYASYFDIDWRPTGSKAALLLWDKVLIPVLGDLYGNVLDNGEFSLHLDDAGIFVRYREQRFPLDPGSYGPILELCQQHLERQPGSAQGWIGELKQLMEEAAAIPPRTSVDASEIGRRRLISQSLKQRLFRCYRDDLDARLAIDAALRETGDTRGNPGGADRLHSILAQQGYRLAHWKVAFEEINYRRFFDVNELVRIRVEDEEVFQARHEPILRLVKSGKVSGLRIDHIDGLHDPQGYLEKLQAAVQQSPAGPGRDFYVVVEKVLGRDETLPVDWPVCGTTGYDFLNVVNDVFIHPEGLQSLDETYASFTGDLTPFAEHCYARNKQVMEQLFAGEVRALGDLLGSLAAEDRQARDIPLSELMHALVEMTACLPVYRTYLRGETADERDRRYIERTLALARRRSASRDAGSAAFDFLARLLYVEPPPYAQSRREEWLRFVTRWQQFTGPVMAKGLEDTACYVHHSLISRNEVGGDALRDKPPRSVEELHAFLATRCERSPHSMNATSTHDTKRGEDVRARINVLSEMPAEWKKRLTRWVRWNRDKKSTIGGQQVPTPAEEVLLYQTLLGAWPVESEEELCFQCRLKSYLVKATREAKTHSDWLKPNETHETAVVHFAEAILEPGETNLFLKDFLRFQESIAFHGALNSLSQTLIKITAPGVPDLYQGTELWNLSLVDPDNRRPVDYAKRISLLEELRRLDRSDRRGLLRSLVQGWRDGRIKLFLTDKALDFRRAHAEVYLRGGYVRVAAAGSRRENLVAFLRHFQGTWALSVAPRWTSQVGGRKRPPMGRRAWADTTICLPSEAPRVWRDVLTGDKVEVQAEDESGHRLRVSDLIHRFPVALLTKE